ncbi:MAG: hypothetical protein EON51_17760 [Acinetobacter sp.]|nr:MAG: hypothetical protein EON51_17760 [Acinetobacter sp.]
MKNKPITAGLHSLTDYAFGVALMTVPKLIGADERAVKLYRALALEIFLYSLFTKQPYAIKALIAMTIHRKIDIGNLSILGLLHFYRKINKDRRITIFNVSMMAAGIATVLLTDWSDSYNKG